MNRVIVRTMALLLLVAGAGCGEDSATGGAESAGSETTAVDDGGQQATTSEAAPEPSSGQESSGETSSGDSPIQLLETASGPILVRSDGQTLYGTIGDVFNDGPQCPSPDPEVVVCDLWEPVLSDNGSELPAGLNEADYTLFETADGFHLAYRRSVEIGLPLYTWIGEGPGEYNGHAHDGNWFVISAEGKLVNDFEVPS